MTQLKEFIYGAGLVPVSGSSARLTEFTLPVVRGFEATATRESLFCNQTGAPPTQATLLYFTLPGCENCQPGGDEFVRLAQSIASQSDVALCMRVVISDWATVSEIQAELAHSSSLRSWGVVWDAEGIIAERLAVLGQPALYLLDGAGQVGAFRNGPVSFVSPGFESFWHSLLQVTKRRALLTEVPPQQVALIDEEILVKSSDNVSFLNNSLLPALWLVSLILLCYSLTRFVLQLRKNFRGSQNKS